MSKWLGQNLTPVLVIIAASLYYFGLTTITYQRHFLHTSPLYPPSTYQEFMAVGAEPIVRVCVTLMGLALALLPSLFLVSRLPESVEERYSPRHVADARSSIGNKTRPPRRILRTLWRITKAEPWRILAIILVEVTVPPATWIGDQLEQNFDLILDPTHPHFLILFWHITTNTFLQVTLVWLMLFFPARWLLFGCVPVKDIVW
jgi:hypothetical protein